MKCISRRADLGNDSASQTRRISRQRHEESRNDFDYSTNAYAFECRRMSEHLSEIRIMALTSKLLFNKELTTHPRVQISSSQEVDSMSRHSQFSKLLRMAMVFADVFLCSPVTENTALAAPRLLIKCHVHCARTTFEQKQ